MKIFTSAQTKIADEQTIASEPILSVDLMERAAASVFDWYIQRFTVNQTVVIFCGVGNNGGDGLVIARLLIEKGYHVTVYEVQFSPKYSTDYAINKKRLATLEVPIFPITWNDSFPEISSNQIIIDAIFGSGLSKPVEGWLAKLILYVNASEGTKISVDIASGLFAENNDANTGVIFEPDYTVCFEFPKLAFLLPNNSNYVGIWEVLPIGLDPNFIINEPSLYHYITPNFISTIHQKAKRFDHKGVYGHALIIAGSYGKMGASVLATKAAITAGAGLVSVQVPKNGVGIMQISLPEAMVHADEQQGYITQCIDYSRVSAIGIGPAIGFHTDTIALFEYVLQEAQKPLVLDADALTILAETPKLWQIVPPNTIITPHLGEWKRIQGSSVQSDFERLQSAQEFAKLHQIIIVLKGANTAVFTPTGDVFFNSTGNPGMATAGSGDTLTGIITGLLAQNYSPIEAAQLGVYIHGLAGDLALEKESRESLTASSIIAFLGRAFKTIS